MPLAKVRRLAPGMPLAQAHVAASQPTALLMPDRLTDWHIRSVACASHVAAMGTGGAKASLGG